MKFSETFHPLKLLDRISFPSISCFFSERASWLGTARSSAESWLTTSSSVLSAPFRLSNSTYSTGLIQCSFISGRKRFSQRSEEHTSELQSLAYLVCRLLLEKKKKK